MYLDSNVILGCLYPDDRLHKWSFTVTRTGETLYTSAATLIELAFVIGRDLNESTVGLTARVHRVLPSLRFVELTSEHMSVAFDLEAEFNLGVMDALHAAVCLSNDSHIATGDKAFKRVNGLTVESPSQPNVPT